MKPVLRIVFVSCLALTSSCTAVVFQPARKFYILPERAIQHRPESFSVEVEDHVFLQGWHFKTKGEYRGIVVQFHGNAENMSSHYLSVAWLLNHGYDLVTFDYRGYGLSDSFPYFPAVIHDAVKVLSFVEDLAKERAESSFIIVYGQSLGSLIATQSLARSKIHVDRLILEGGIFSLNQVSASVLSRHWLTWVFQPLAYVLVSPRYNFKKIANSFPSIPTLVLHSQKDPVVPVKQGKKLLSHLPGSPVGLFVEEPGHIHIGNVSKGRYRKEILKFLSAPTSLTH